MLFSIMFRDMELLSGRVATGPQQQIFPGKCLELLSLVTAAIIGTSEIKELNDMMQRSIKGG